MADYTSATFASAMYPDTRPGAVIFWTYATTWSDPGLERFHPSRFPLLVGGTGYLLRNYSPLITPLVLFAALAAGTAGASLLYIALFKLLLPRERVLSEEDTRMDGVVGRVSDEIRDDVVRAMAEPLANVDKITIVSTGSDDHTGVNKLTGDMTKMAAQVPALFEALSGMKMCDLMANVKPMKPRVVDANDDAK